MRGRDIAIVIGCSLAVSVPLGILQARDMAEAEAKAFGRGAIAGLCRVLEDRHPDPATRSAEVTASLSRCRPYLDELHHRTGGQS